PGVLPYHLDALHARGLTNETIKAAGIYSETDKTKLASILGRKRLGFKSAAIVIPFSDLDGRNGYARVRPDCPRVDKDKKPVKYESPTADVKGSNRLYFPPGVVSLISDVGQTLIFTEGEFKALAATQYG